MEQILNDFIKNIGLIDWQCAKNGINIHFKVNVNFKNIQELL